VGALFEVEPGDWRTIEFIDLPGFTTSSGSAASAFNDRGELAFTLRFTDGSAGVFVARIPAPGGSAPLGVGLLAAMRRRR